MSSIPLKQSIFQTLTYFDLFNFPLTQEELFAYLWRPPAISYGEFVVSLRAAAEAEKQSPRLGGNLGDRHVPSGLAMTETKFGFHFLPGRESIVETRRTATIPTERKLRKARRAAWFIRRVPFLCAIFVCNTVGAQIADAASDIDFFIIAEKKRIWIARFFTNLILRLLRLRTYGAHERDRVCLSFYVDNAHLSLSPWRVCEDDIHLAYWLHQMIPIHDPDDYYARFLAANSWTRKFLPNLNYQPSNSKLFPKRFTAGKLWQKFWEAMWRGKYGDLIENQARQWQYLKLKLAVKEKAQQPDQSVVISDGVLKFHEHDPRRKIKEAWQRRIAGH